MIFRKWINIRGASFVKAWCNIVKIKQFHTNKQKIAKKKEKALRKELKKYDKA